MLTINILASIIFLLPMALYLTRLIKDPFHPLIFIGTVSFFVTAWGIFVASDRIILFVEERDVINYMLVSILAVLGCYAGWFLHRRRQAKLPPLTPAQTPQFDPNKLILWAILCDLVGVGAYFYTRGEYTVTGYLREFGSLWVVGAILSVQCMLISPSLRPVALVTLLVALSPPIDRFLSYGQRSDTFRSVIIFLPVFFYRQKRPNPAFFIPLAIAFALVMGTLERTRVITARDESIGRFGAIVKVIPSFFDKEYQERVSGGETFVYGPAMVRAVREKGEYDYGAFAFNIAIRFLPKEFFNKDQYYTQWTVAEYGKTTSQVIGYQVALGAAPTGFAHAFVEFGWLAPLFWMLLGYRARAIYHRTCQTLDLRSHALLTCWYIIVLLLLTQDLYMPTMNAIYLLPAVFIAFHFSRVRDSASATTNVALAA